MKFVPILALSASIILSFQLLADEKFSLSGTASVTSNYIWRGATQTQSSGTAQVGIDLNNVANVSGFYLGTWVSGYSVGSEIDAIIGYTKTVSTKFTYDLGYSYYHYTLAGFSYGEAYLGTTIDEDYGLKVFIEDGLQDTTDITLEATASFGPVDLTSGTHIAADSANAYNYISLGVNWPCIMDGSYDMNALVSYNEATSDTQTLFATLKGAAFSLTISKEF